MTAITNTKNLQQNRVNNEQGSKKSFSTTFFVWFFKKNVSRIAFINWSNFRLSLPFEILDNLCIIIVCFPSCDVINFEIKIWKLRQKFKYLENGKSL